MMSEPVRIAMWSGPRNISTAMMRAWDTRDDSIVCDEPLYAHYLKTSGKPHPLAEEIIEKHNSDWRSVVDWLTGVLPDGKTLFYQKQMSHHLTPDVEKDWLLKVSNCFLIRNPREMLTSYLKKIPDPIAEDTGYPQLVEIFNYVREKTGQVPTVVDSRDFLTDPAAMLKRLCGIFELEYSDSMLSWESGFRDTDGCWAEYWYTEVPTSTGFRSYRPKEEEVPPEFAALHDECQALYEKLYEHRLTI
jgi:hypothetical protein